MSFYKMILIISFFSLALIQQQKSLKLIPFYKGVAKNRAATLVEQTLLSSGMSKEAQKIYTALICGYKRSINKKSKKAWQNFGLLHLMTPSGIHFASIYFFIKFLPIRLKILSIFIFFSIISLTSGFFALKRIFLFKLLYLTAPKFFTIKKAFIATFIIDFFLYFHTSPLSSIFSFLFWGTIISHKGGFKSLAYKLFFNLLLVSFIHQTLFNPLSLILNTPLSVVFSLLFPVLLFNLILEFKWIYLLFDSYINWLSSSLVLLDPLSTYANLFTLLCLVAIYSNKKYFLILFLIFNTSAIHPEKIKIKTRSYYKIKKAPKTGLEIHI